MTRRKSPVSVHERELPHTCMGCGNEHDPNSTLRQYHEAEFRIIPPHGSDGRTMNYPGFQAPPLYARIVELLYSEQLTPWRTQSDVMRAFLDLGCAHFGGAIGGHIAPGVQHKLNMMNRLIERAREANDFAQSIDQLDREVTRLVDNNMRESAVGLVYQYREQAKAIGEHDRILQRKLVGDINTRFGWLLKGNQGRKDHETPGLVSVRVDPDHNEHAIEHGD